ncbi:MAG: hypothetical protein ACI4S2_13495 [Lachnospiraceae bacterium]
MKRRGIKGIFLALFVIVGMSCLLPGNQAEAKSKTKVSYKKVTETRTWEADDGTILVKATYKGIKIKGSSSAVKKMNKVLEKEKNQFFKTAAEAKENAQSVYEDQTYYNPFYVSEFYISSKVTFNKKGIVSIKEVYDGYHSGAAHGYYYTYGHTFKISSGKELKFNQVVSGSDKTDKKKLVTAFKKMYNKEPDKYFEDAIDTVRSSNVKKQQFYLSGKYAIACYAPYNLSSFAEGETLVKVKHRYN